MAKFKAIYCRQIAKEKGEEADVDDVLPIGKAYFFFKLLKTISSCSA